MEPDRNRAIGAESSHLRAKYTDPETQRMCPRMTFCEAVKGEQKANYSKMLAPWRAAPIPRSPRFSRRKT